MANLERLRVKFDKSALNRASKTLKFIGEPGKVRYRKSLAIGIWSDL